MNSLTLLQGSQMPALCLLSGTLGGIIGSFLGVVVERIPRSLKRRRGRKPAVSGLPLSRMLPHARLVGKYPGSELVLPAWALPLLPDRDPAASAVA